MRSDTPHGGLLFRVQAADGRGPWRPGLSKHWIDRESDQRFPEDWINAFGLENILSRIPKGSLAGCACRAFDGLFRWFTPTERKRLDAMGYKPVALYPDKIIAENSDQVVFVRRLPFNQAAVVLAWENPDLEAPLRCLKPPRAA